MSIATSTDMLARETGQSISYLAKLAAPMAARLRMSHDAWEKRLADGFAALARYRSQAANG